VEKKRVRSINAGEEIVLKVSQDVSALIVIKPDGKRREFYRRKLEQESDVHFKDTAVTGYYQVGVRNPKFGGMKKLSTSSFIVNTPAVESDLRVSFKAISKGHDSLYTRVKSRFPIWSYLLLGAVVFLMLESFIAGLGLAGGRIKKR
jgi:hypothetical protein